jgi:hypothetical protein
MEIKLNIKEMLETALINKSNDSRFYKLIYLSDLVAASAYEAESSLSKSEKAQLIAVSRRIDRFASEVHHLTQQNQQPLQNKINAFLQEMEQAA